MIKLTFEDEVNENLQLRLYLIDREISNEVYNEKYETRVYIEIGYFEINPHEFEFITLSKPDICSLIKELQRLKKLM